MEIFGGATIIIISFDRAKTLTRGTHQCCIRVLFTHKCIIIRTANAVILQDVSFVSEITVRFSRGDILRKEQ